MNLVELDRALRQLRLSGMHRPRNAAPRRPADAAYRSGPRSCDELQRRQDRFERRHKQARFRDAAALDTFDFFQPK